VRVSEGSWDRDRDRDRDRDGDGDGDNSEEPMVGCLVQGRN
jgi:hypothetical protein